MASILNSIAANPHQLQSLAHVATAWGQLRDLAVELAKPIVPLDLLEELRDKAQRKLTDLIIRKADRSLLDLARSSDQPELNLARILSCKGKDAGAWLNAIPKLPIFTLEPADARIAFRFYLGMTQPCVTPGTTCACVRGPTVDPRGYHYLCCGAGGHILSRHNHLQSIGDQMAKTTGRFSTTHGLLGVLPWPDWQNPDGDALKPDQKIHDFHEDGRSVLLDYTVCHPCAASYVSAASRIQLYTAAHVEKAKEGEYSAASEAEGSL